MIQNTLVVFLIVAIIPNMFAQNRIPIITAHRGASGYAPENTLSAMDTAMSMGADYSELDVQETADGRLILLHDGNLKRTTGIDKNIWETNYDELQNMDAGSWLGDEFAGERIPTLAEVIDLVKGKMKLNIELKINGREKKLADLAVKIVKEENFTGNCIFTSFDYEQIKRVKEIDGSLKTGLIFSQIPEDIDVFSCGFEVLSVNHKLVDKEFMDKAKSSGKEVYVWTVNEVDEMKRLIDLGVASIITNYPDKLRDILAQRN